MSTDRCRLSCTLCGRRCHGTAFGRQSHRFDCCGEVRAHVPSSNGTGWFRSGMEAGYLTGPSCTTVPGPDHPAPVAVTDGTSNTSSTRPINPSH